jgi:hypothetical protein
MIRAEDGQEEFQFGAARMFPRGGHGMAIAVRKAVCGRSRRCAPLRSLARSIDRSIDSKVDRDRHHVIATAVAASEDLVLASSSSSSRPCAFFWFLVFCSLECRSKQLQALQIRMSLIFICYCFLKCSFIPFVHRGRKKSELSREKYYLDVCKPRGSATPSQLAGFLRRGIRSKKVSAGRWRCVPGWKQQYRRLGLTLCLGLSRLR